MELCVEFPWSLWLFSGKTIRVQYLDMFSGCIVVVLVYFLPVCKAEKDKPAECLLMPLKWALYNSRLHSAL